MLWSSLILHPIKFRKLREYTPQGCGTENKKPFKYPKIFKILHENKRYCLIGQKNVK